MEITSINGKKHFTEREICKYFVMLWSIKKSRVLSVMREIGEN